MVERTGSSNSCLLEGMNSVKSRDNFEFHSSGAEHLGDNLSWTLFIKANTPRRDWCGLPTKRNRPAKYGRGFVL